MGGIGISMGGRVAESSLNMLVQMTTPPTINTTTTAIPANTNHSAPELDFAFCGGAGYMSG